MLLTQIPCKARIASTTSYAQTVIFKHAMLPIQAVIKSIAERKVAIDSAITSGFGPGASLMYRYCGITKDHFGRDALQHTNPNAYDSDASAAMRDYGPSDGTGNKNSRPFRFTVTLYQEDRDGDVVVPRGLETKNYFHNPVWFFGHQSYQVPIGLCRPCGTQDKKYDPTAPIGWYSEDHRTQADLYVDWLDPDAAFIGGKIERGLLSCVSIAFVPIEAERRGYEEKANPRQSPLLPPGWIFHRADVTEVSVVGIPSNAGAYRDILDREKGFMSPRLQKGWEPYCAQAKGCWNGWCPCPPNPDGTCGPCETRKGWQEDEAAAAEKDKDHRLPHVREGMWVCECGKRWHTQEAAKQCHGQSSVTALRGKKGLKYPVRGRFAKSLGDRVSVVTDKGDVIIDKGTVTYEGDRTEVIGDGRISGMFPNQYIKPLGKSFEQSRDYIHDASTPDYYAKLNPRTEQWDVYDANTTELVTSERDSRDADDRMRILQRHRKKSFDASVKKYIRRCGTQYCVYSKKGKRLGSHPTKEKAEAQLRAIEANSHKTEKAIPEGPYTSPTTTGNWYLVETVHNGQHVWSVVRDGQQPNQGLISPTRRDALAWLRDNGYVKKEAKPMVKKHKCGCKDCKKHKPCPCKKGNNQADTEASKPTPYRELLGDSKDPKDGPQIQNGKKTSPKGKKGLNGSSGVAGGYTLANANGTSGTVGQKKPKKNEQEQYIDPKDKVQVTKKKPKTKKWTPAARAAAAASRRANSQGSGKPASSSQSSGGSLIGDIGEGIGSAMASDMGIGGLGRVAAQQAGGKLGRGVAEAVSSNKPKKKSIKDEEEKNVMDDGTYAFAGEQTPEEEALESQMGEQQPHSEYDGEIPMADDTGDDQDMHDDETDADDGDDHVKAGALHYAKNIAHLQELDNWNDDQLPKHEPEVGEHFAPHHEAIKKLHSDMTDSFNERYPDHDLEKIMKGVAGPPPDADPDANLEGEEGMVNEGDTSDDDDTSDADEDVDVDEDKDADVSEDEGTEADEEDVGDAGDTDDDEGSDEDSSTEEILERYRKPKSGSVVAVFTGQRMNVYGKVLKIAKDNTAQVKLRGGKVIKRHISQLSVVKGALGALGAAAGAGMGAVVGGPVGAAAGGALGSAVTNSPHSVIHKAADHMEALAKAPDLPVHHNAGLVHHAGQIRKALEDMGSQDSGSDELDEMGSQDSGSDELTNEGNEEEIKSVDWNDDGTGNQVPKNVDWNNEGDVLGPMAKGDTDDEAKCSGMTSKQQEDYWAKRKQQAAARFSKSWFRKTGEKIGADQ